MLKLTSITSMSTGNGPVRLSLGDGEMPRGAGEPSTSRKNALVVSANRSNAFMDSSFKFFCSFLGVKVNCDVFSPSGNQVAQFDFHHSRGVITHRNLDAQFSRFAGWQFQLPFANHQTICGSLTFLA